MSKAKYKKDQRCKGYLYYIKEMCIVKINEWIKTHFIQTKFFPFKMKNYTLIRKIKNLPLLQYNKRKFRQQSLIPIQKMIKKEIQLQFNIYSRNIYNQDNCIETMRIFDKISFKKKVLLMRNKQYNDDFQQENEFNLYDNYSEEIINDEYQGIDEQYLFEYFMSQQQQNDKSYSLHIANSD